jgi:PAS domain S-box-containing protein
VAIIATDLELRVLQWNRAAERLFGWTAAEIVGQPYPLATEAMLPDVHRIRDRALRDSTYIDIHAQRCRKDGSLVDLSLSVGVIRNSLLQPGGFVLLAADVSERKKLEEQLRHAQKMDAVGQLAGGIAHDFNNLLTVVTGYAGIILADLSPDDQMRPDVKEIIGAADRAGVLTRQLLAFSRQQMLQPKVLDLNVAVHGMEHMLRRVLPSDIKFITRLDPSLSAVNADPGQIEQVLMNLIVNARDAMPDGGTLTVETRNFSVTAGSSAEHDIAPGDYSMLSVNDTGYGMTKEVQARIFEPFFTTKGREEGNGLGLSTAHGIVTQSGGYLSVQSEPAVGTTIMVCLPCANLSSGSTAQLPGAEPRGAAVILLVEDDPSVRLSTKRILERAGYTVLVAADGKEALAVHSAHGSRIDLLVSDMIMPEISGRELAARIHERDPNVAVLIMSGYTEQASRSRSLVESGSAFIHKPFTPEALMEKVRDTINASALHATA